MISPSSHPQFPLRRNSVSRGHPCPVRNSGPIFPSVSPLPSPLDITGLNTFALSVFNPQSVIEAHGTLPDSEGPITLSVNKDAFGLWWHVAENPALTLMLDGHLYLRESPSLAVEKNLEKLLYRMSVTTVEKGLEEIAGGMFNLIIHDKEHRRMLIVGDRLGALPLYFMENETGVHVSGHQLAFRHMTRIFDAAAVEFLKYGYLPFSPSLFENVRRLLPGQRLIIDLRNGRASLTSPAVLKFKPLQHRVTDLVEAGEMLHQALEQFFFRLDEAGCALELDGGYPTRLIAAWLKGASASALVYPMLPPPEQKISRQLASAFGLPLTAASALASPMETWLNAIGQLCRLPCSPDCPNAIRAALPTQPDASTLLISRFGGRHLVGTAEFDYPLEPIPWKDYLLGKVNYNSPIRSIMHYQERLYHLPGAIPDYRLGSILRQEFECWFLNAARGILEINRDAGHVHEDFLESLYIFTRLRCQEAAVPVEISRRMPWASPFLDYEIMQVFYDTDKNLRGGQRLINYYWQRYFPEVARIPSAETGGKPGDGERLYRLKQVLSVFTRRGKLAPKHGQPGLTKEHFFDIKPIETGGPSLHEIIRETLEAPHEQIPFFIAESIHRLALSGRLDYRMLIRYTALNRYLAYPPSQNGHN